MKFRVPRKWSGSGENLSDPGLLPGHQITSSICGSLAEMSLRAAASQLTRTRMPALGNAQTRTFAKGEVQPGVQALLSTASLPGASLIR